MRRKIAGHSNSKEFHPPVYKWRRNLCRCTSECFVYYCAPRGKGIKIYFTCLPFAEGFFEPEGPNILLMLAHCGIMFLLHGSHAQAIFLLFLSYPPVSLAITTLHTLQKKY